MKEKAKKEIGVLLGVIVAVALAVVAAIAGQSVKSLEVKNFENSRKFVAIKKEKSVLFFYRDNCPDCQKIFAQVYTASKIQKVQFINTNNLENRDKYLGKYNIEYVPTFIVTDKNGKEQTRYTGTDSKKIKKILSEAK